MPVLCLALADPALCEAIAEQPALAALGEVRVADGAAELSAALEGEIALLLIDQQTADRKIRAHLRAMAAAGKKFPVLVIGADETDEEWAAESFALPVRLGHLIARTQFHMQAARRSSRAPLRFGPWRLDTRLRQAAHDDGTVLRLTEKEVSLLDYLGQHAGPAGREELLAAIWGYDARIDTHTLETHVYRLRRKLEGDAGGETILYAEGAYRLAP
ncbi:MAG TPA: response regulator transcription factor [Alphaproteobacteria bacterium]|nr:response regulator transcription factor [Alphaproteobacteria bacterium]